jgi:hypothetical protein
MSSQLHQAVQLAQAGHRDEARDLLRQLLQFEPNNEVAWLWLASVAVDQAEYVRALNEVLRINPENPQARQLLADFNQQYGPQIYGPQQPSRFGPQMPPPPSPYGPQMPQYPPQTPYYGGPAYSQERPGTPAGGIPVAPQGPQRPIYVQREAPAPRRGGGGGCMGCGCFSGCIRSCLFTAFILVVVPALLCIGLTFLGNSLGPLDMAAVYLPGDMGRKDVKFEVQGNSATTYEVAVTVPRSWYPAIEDDTWWTIWRELLEDTIAFESPDNEWASFTLPLEGDSITIHEVDLNGTQAENAFVPILETNPAELIESGAPAGLIFAGITNATTNGRQEDVVPVGERIFADYSAPAEMHVVAFSDSVGSGSAATWLIFVPEDRYDHFRDDIEAIIDSAQVTRR